MKQTSAETSICIVANAGSGKQDVNPLEEALARLRESFGDVTLREVEKGRSPTDVAKEAVDQGFKVIVAAGGDGTICAVANAVRGSASQLGILPMGTFNFFARGLDIPDDLKDALAILVEGHTKPVTMAEVNGRIFLNNASLGIYPAILAQREAVYKRWGRSQLAAYWSVILTLFGFKRSRAVTVTVDGVKRRRKTPLVFISNSAFQLEEYELEGADYVRNGELAVFLTPDVGRLGLLRYAVRLLGRSMQRHKDFELFHGRDILIEGRGRRLVAMDGEREKMHGPFRFQLLDDALHVIVPSDRKDASGRAA